jgi:hypothetical protein
MSPFCFAERGFFCGKYGAIFSKTKQVILRNFKQMSRSIFLPECDKRLLFIPETGTRPLLTFLQPVTTVSADSA